MRDETVQSSTGRSIAEWTRVISEGGLDDASHKEIADYLHERHGVSYWWAQEITVEYEKRVGRRMTGQTEDGLFQIGVRRTLKAPPEVVWAVVASEQFVAMLGASPLATHSDLDANESNDERLAALNETSTDGVTMKTTTFRSQTRFRMQWKLPDWPHHSILQVTVSPKAGKRCVLAFHQEKIPSQAAREEMRTRWTRCADAVTYATSER